jgi:hypothetical protein
MIFIIRRAVIAISGFQYKINGIILRYGCALCINICIHTYDYLFVTSIGVIPPRYLPNVNPKPEDDEAEETLLLRSGLLEEEVDVLA